ncbi:MULTISPECIES: Lsr2 family protein [unclassified Frigoribacterium]|uniref:histone-like nucleoid-structuring protein Lsr2 n=1 Tax=unclassified Frigoribacterium TaxID=2627005 RepID=UPI0006F5963A|nr:MULTISPECIES: Lsr2 family protein [unclassified Frigoribacterium]KQO81976.1 hypothetical protein ASF17_12950 [Frigoribacterium sp. Leaf263]KQR66324.1 hypothetical protein ASF89_04200 [Frigoribacterium sp. Leaf172]
MAQKTFIQLVDDIDGTPIADGEGRTVTFAIDGASYEIDLTDAHVAELVYALEPFTSGGRRTGRRTSAPAARAGSPRPKSDPAELQRIREWARENGHDVSDRGRVSGAIREAYDAAH